MYQTHFEILRNTRQNILTAVENLSDEQLNIIPEKYNNNLVWNLGHVIVTHQRLVYVMSGLKTKLEPDFIGRYSKGTKPETIVSSEEIEFIKSNFFSTIDGNIADLKEGIFTTYKEYPTSYGFTLKSVEDAIIFNNIHEGVHYGSILALRKLV